MLCTNQTAKNFPACGFREPKPPDLNWFIKNKYITKNEAEVYRFAEKNGFDCEIDVYGELANSGSVIFKTAIRITKTKRQ